MQLLHTKMDRFYRPLKLDEILFMTFRNDIYSFSDMEISGKECHTAEDISHFPLRLTSLLSKVKYYFNDNFPRVVTLSENAEIPRNV